MSCVCTRVRVSTALAQFEPGACTLHYLNQTHACYSVAQDKKFMPLVLFLMPFCSGSLKLNHGICWTCTWSRPTHISNSCIWMQQIYGKACQSAELEAIEFC